MRAVLIVRHRTTRDLVSSYLLIRRVEMETNREVAWRKPPAAGLAACLYRSTDMMHCSHKDKNMRSCEQYITLLQAQQSAVRGSLNPNGSAHTFNMVALLATT